MAWQSKGTVKKKHSRSDKPIFVAIRPSTVLSGVNVDSGLLTSQPPNTPQSTLKSKSYFNNGKINGYHVSFRFDILWTVQYPLGQGGVRKMISHYRRDHVKTYYTV